MFNTYQNNPGLPFNPQQPTSQMMQFNAPPFAPNNIQIPAVVQPYFAAICTLVANEVTGSANQHAGRMYTFNQVSSNNWQNNYYVELVTIAVDMVSMNIAKQQHPSIENAVTDGVRSAIGLFVSMNIVEQQGLHHILDANVLQAATTNVSQMQGIKNEIMHYKNMLMQSAQQPQFQQQMFGAQQHMGNVNQGFNINPALANRMMPGGFNSPAPVTPINTVSNNLFTNTNTNTNPVFTNNTGDQANSRYATYANNAKPISNDAPQEQSKYANYAKTTAPENVQKPIAEYEIVTRDDWCWSIHQPIRDTLIDKLSSRLEWRRYHNNGAPYVKSVVIPLTGEEMNKAEHMFNEQASPAQWDSALSKGFSSPVESRKATREKALTSVVNTRDKTNPQQSNEITAVVSDTTHIDVSVEGVLIDMALQNQTIPENQLVREYIEVATPIISKVPEKQNKPIAELIDKIDSMKHMKLTQVASTLGEMVKEGTEQAENVANEINDILTAKTNEVLRNNFSLKVQIDSFMEDIGELPKYLSDKYGDAVVNKFVAMTDFIIKNTLITVESKAINIDLDETTDPENAEETSEDKPINFVSIFLGKIYSASFINQHSKQLGVSKIKEQEKVADPLLENICKNIFSCREKINAQTSVWLLVTADYKVFKLYKGALTGSFDTFIIEPFKQ